MTLYWPDWSNNNWRSTAAALAACDSVINKEGYSAIVHKVSEGSGYRDPFWPAVRDWCASNDVPCMGYHYVRVGDPTGQARAFTSNGGGKLAMLDFEDGSGDMSNFWAVVNAFNAAGVQIALSYIPHWYWYNIGSPSLAGVPGLVSSSYYERGKYASTEYEDAGGDSGQGWTGYGGATPIVWQFTDAAVMAGFTADANAYKGDINSLRTLFGLQPIKPEGPFMALTDDEQAELLAKTRYIYDQVGPGFDVWGADGDLGLNAAGQRRTVRTFLAALGRTVGVKNG